MPHKHYSVLGYSSTVINFAGVSIPSQYLWMYGFVKEAISIDDFSYDCMIKKRVASGAKHMKKGSKSKKCSLPSDALTEAQLRKRNGEVTNMNMGTPTSLKDFKKWPVDIQKEYLMKYINEFGCTIADLTQIFGCSYSAFRKHLSEIGFDTSVFSTGKRMSQENRFKFRQWLSTYRPEFSDGEQINLDSAAVTKNEERPSSTLMGTPRMCMDFTGLLNVHQIANTLLSVANGKRVKVSVVIEEVEE